MKKLEKRRLGNSTLNITPIGLGCRNISQRLKEKDAVELIQKAVELGINLVDTADIYGRGKSEEIVGQAISPMRKKVVLATKGGIRITSKGKPTQDLSSNHIRKAVKESLDRLRTDYIDLYQIHYADPETPSRETVKALNEFVETGEIKHVGLSNFPQEELVEWLELQSVASIQMPYNLLQTKNYSELLPICKSKNINILVYTPLLMGLLTEKVEKYTGFSENDERSVIPSFVIEKCREIIKALRTVAEKNSKTVTQMLLGWLSNQPMIGSVLVGASSLQQLEENIEAVEMRLTVEEKRCIEEIVRKEDLKIDNMPVLTEKVVDVFTNYVGKKVARLEMGMKILVPREVEKGHKIMVSWNGEFIKIT